MNDTSNAACYSAEDTEARRTLFQINHAPGDTLFCVLCRLPFKKRITKTNHLTNDHGIKSLFAQRVKRLKRATSKGVDHGRMRSILQRRKHRERTKIGDGPSDEV